MRRLMALLMGLAAGLAQGAEPVERIDFNHPQRSYLRCAGQAWVFYEQEAGEEKAALSASACRKFAEHQAHVLQQLPASARPFFNGVNVFLMLGEKSAQGGHRSGMRYVRQGEPRDANGYDPRWAHGIVVYSTANQPEYFAELSAAYFVGINHFPFDREGLRHHDPAGAAMVEAVWSLR